ncbi:MAG TPA: glycosyltransferase family 2 protein [bacterium]|nr:glycosyltransferase family 2 protein [bacterium]
MPLVSVICPVYNCEMYVEQAVRSVVDQTYQNWELLLIDDGSSDSSWNTIERLANSDKRICALHHERHANLGVSATRNLGIARASGDYLAFLDADDVWLPGKLERQIDVVTRYPQVGFVYGQALCIDEAGRPLSEPRSAWSLEGVIGGGFEERPVWAYRHIVAGRGFFPPCSTILARTDLVRRCGGFILALRHQVEDYVLWTELLKLAPAFYVPLTLAMYRVGAQSWTARQTVSSRRDAEWEYVRTLAKVFGRADGPISRRAARMVSDILFSGGAERSGRLARGARSLGGVMVDRHFGFSGKLSVLGYLATEGIPLELMAALRHRTRSLFGSKARRTAVADTVDRK